MRNIKLSFLLVSFTFGFANLLFADSSGLKYRVRVLPSEDRWITFSDGEKLYHGSEVSYLISEFLYRTESFNIVRKNSLGTLSLDNDIETEVKRRLPDVDWTFLKDQNTFKPLSDIGITKIIHMTIKPRVKSLWYTSGNGSNRIAYGFTPEILNPFNEGRLGSQDNEFVLKGSQLNCKDFNYFQDRISPGGWGPGRSNFGSDFDEGLTFSVAGYGFGFKKKAFTVYSEIEFEVEFHRSNEKVTFEYRVDASGKDLFFSGEFSGFGVQLEILRRKTLRKALQKLLPEISQKFVDNRPSINWESQIISTHTGAFMEGGVDDGVKNGMVFESSLGAKYTVIEAGHGLSLVKKDKENWTEPYVGEPLRIYEGQSPWGQIKTFAVEDKKVSQSLVLSMKDITPPEDVKDVIDTCFKGRGGKLERFFEQFAPFLAWWRYKKVFNKNFKNQIEDDGRPRIAVLGSGIYSREKDLKNSLDSSGFDFLSWDEIPSDEMGMGTAAALLLNKNVHRPISIIPFKVIGPHGETHSSAIYEALKYIAKRPDITHVVIPFIPKIDSKALSWGVELVMQSGKIVVAPSGIHVSGPLLAKPTDGDFHTKGLKAKVFLSREGAGAIMTLADLINGQKR